MKSEILFQGSYALLKVDLEPGEEVKAEPGAMVAMTDTITMQVKKSSSGFFKSLKARFLGGENFFNSYFRAEDQPGSLFLAPKAPGSIAKLSRNPGEFGKWLMAFIPLPSSSPSKSFSGTRQHFEDEYNRSEEFENEPEEFDIESEPFEEVDPSFDDSEDI